MSEPVAADELPHAPGTGAAWRESYGFELFDAASGLVGTARLVLRPNETAREAALTFFLEDGGLVTARHVTSHDARAPELSVEGVRFTMLEPLRRWRIDYDGPSHSLASAADAARPEAWQRSRLERLIVELEFAASSAGVPHADGFAQPGLWSGEVWVSGDRYAVAAPGIRERAWGPEAAPRAQRRFALALGDGTVLRALDETEDGGSRCEGWVMRDGAVRAVRVLDGGIEPDAGPPQAFHLVLTDDAGERHEVAGELPHVASLPGFRGGHRTLLHEGVARARSARGDGFGLVSDLHRLDAAGSPVEPVR